MPKSDRRIRRRQDPPAGRIDFDDTPALIGEIKIEPIIAFSDTDEALLVFGLEDGDAGERVDRGRKRLAAWHTARRFEELETQPAPKAARSECVRFNVITYRHYRIALITIVKEPTTFSFGSLNY